MADLQVIPRSAWTDTPPGFPAYPSRLFDKAVVTYLAPHYPANGAAIGVMSEAAEQSYLRGIRNFHVNTREWADIGYGLAIFQSGRCYMAGGITHSTAHASNMNPYAIGVLFAVGDDEPPSAEAIATFNRLGPWLRDTQGFNALATVLDHGRLPGVPSTSCAGKHIRAAVDSGALTLTGDTMALPANTGRPAGVAALEKALRAQGYDVYCGPSDAGKDCIRGKHGHLWVKNSAGAVVDYSTHYVDANGGIAGTHVGGAIDVGKDPSLNVPQSLYEQVRLDDLARQLEALGYGVISGVDKHYDHLHADYIKANTNIKQMGPNGALTVPQVEAFQRAANTLGWTLVVDGVRGPATATAATTLQKLAGLTADGYPGTATMTAVNGFVTLNAGFTIPYVRDRIQTGLATLGHYKGALDGLLGDGTRTAVKAIQKAAGLTQDGLPGPATLSAITAALNPVPVPKPEPTPTPTPVPEPTPTPTPAVPVHRVMGPGRFETAAAARTYEVPDGRGVILYADGSPDMPAAVGLEVRTGHPALPVRKDSVPSAIADTIKALAPEWVAVVGGTLAVSDTTAKAAAQAAASK